MNLSKQTNPKERKEERVVLKKILIPEN